MSQQGGELIGRVVLVVCLILHYDVLSKNQKMKFILKYFLVKMEKELNSEYKLNSIIKNIPNHEEWAESVV